MADFGCVPPLKHRLMNCVFRIMIKSDELEVSGTAQSLRITSALVLLSIWTKIPVIPG